MTPPDRPLVLVLVCLVFLAIGLHLGTTLDAVSLREWVRDSGPTVVNVAGIVVAAMIGVSAWRSVQRQLRQNETQIAIALRQGAAVSAEILIRKAQTLEKERDDYRKSARPLTEFDWTDYAERNLGIKFRVSKSIHELALNVSDTIKFYAIRDLYDFENSINPRIEILYYINRVVDCCEKIERDYLAFLKDSNQDPKQYVPDFTASLTDLPRLVEEWNEKSDVYFGGGFLQREIERLWKRIREIERRAAGDPA